MRPWAYHRADRPAPPFAPLRCPVRGHQSTGGSGGARASCRHRRRRRWDEHRVPPHGARLERRHPRRPGGAHLGLDLPFRRPRGAAPLERDPDPDDDVRQRPVPSAGRRDRRRSVVARGRLPPPRIQPRALRGAGAPGRLGQDVRTAARAHRPEGGRRPLPAHEPRRRPRRRLPAHRRLARPVRAGPGHGGRRSQARRPDPDPYARRRHRRDGWSRPGRDRRTSRRALGDRGRRRRQRRRHVRARDRPPRGRDRADHPDGPPVPVHGAPARRRAHACRRCATRTTCATSARRSAGCAWAATSATRRRGRSTACRPTSTAASSRRTGRGSRRSRRARSGACPRSPMRASTG